MDEKKLKDEEIKYLQIKRATRSYIHDLDSVKTIIRRRIEDKELNMGQNMEMRDYEIFKIINLVLTVESEIDKIKPMFKKLSECIDD